MEIKSLPQEVRSQLRNGTNINNITQCVTELVLNSLDAKSTAVAVRVNLLTFQIQVVDNGKGITKLNMIPIGNRFMTSKCQSLADLKHIKYFGFRGEALASIRGISKSVSISSRPEDVENTYSKVCKNGKWGEVECIKKRPSKGTTVTVEGFMNNLPVRQKRINQSVDMENIKKMLENLAIINSNVTFNLRNDANGKTILKSSKTLSVSQALVNFYPHISIENLVQVKVSRDKITISGLIYKSTFNNNKLQFLYLNKRVIISSKIQKLVNSLLSKLIFKKSENNCLRADKNVNNKNEYPVYVLNIRCPYSEVDLTLCPTKKNVEFKNWDVILACFKKAINSLEQNEVLLDLNDSKEPENKMETLPLGGCKSQFGISQFGGVIKSIPIRRNNIIEKPNESPLIINQDKSSDYSSNIQMLNPETKSHCDDTIDELLLSCAENEKEIIPNSKVGDKRKIEETNNDNQTKKSKIDENVNDSDSFFDELLSKSEEKKTVQVKQVKKDKMKITKTQNNEIKDSAAIIPLKKVAERIGASGSLDNVADNCVDLSFGNTDANCFPIFYPNQNTKEKSNSKKLTDKSVSARDHRNDSKNIVLKELNNFPLEHKSGSKSTGNHSNAENEAEGKKFIMDMFIKSTAMYPDDEELNVSRGDEAIIEKKDEEVKKIVDSGEGKDKRSIEIIEKHEESSEEVLPKICFGQHTLNDMKMPQFGSMECFRQPIVHENINIISEDLNIITGDIFENTKCRAKSICYRKSVYKTTMPKSILNLETYQQLMQPKSNCYDFLNMNKNMFSNFENNFANYNRNSRNAAVPLYQRHHTKSHIPKINEIIFQHEQFNYNFATKKINSFGLRFCKNFDRKVNSNFEKQDYVFKSVDDKLQTMELNKSIIKPSRLNIPSNLKNLWRNEVRSNNFDYGREQLYKPVFQQWIPDVKIKNPDHVFKIPHEVPLKPKEVCKFKKPFPVPGREDGCRSPYFGKPTAKRRKHVFPENHQNVFHLKENQSSNHQKIVSNQLFQEDEGRFFQNDQMNTSKYFKKKKSLPTVQKYENRFFENDEMNTSKYFKKKKSPFLENNRKSNFAEKVQETDQNTNFVKHFENIEKISSFPVNTVDKHQHSEPIFLRNTEVIDENPHNFFPKTIERKEFIECPQKKPQCSKLSLKKIKSNSSEFFTDLPNLEFQEKSIYFQQKNFPKSIFTVDQNKNNQTVGNYCDEFKLPSQHQNMNVTFKSGKMIYQENEETCAFVHDDVAKNVINSTAGFKHFQPKLSSTVIDKSSPIKERVDENINIDIQKEQADNPSNLIVLTVEIKKNCNYEDEEIRSSNCFPIEVEQQCSPSDKNNDNCEKIEARRNCNALHVTIEDLKKLLKTSNDDIKNNVDNNNESKNNCNVLNASTIEDLRKALLISFEVNSQTQKDCSMLNSSIADLRSIFCEINKKKKDSNLEILKPSPKKSNDEWIEHINQYGNLTYLNERTGMTSLIKPHKDSVFPLAPRINFFPNGFPPLLKQDKPVNLSLSPKSKIALNTVILESYEDELNTIKWTNLIDKVTDAKQFFDDLYREKTKQFDRLIPNVSVNTLPRGIVKICNNLEAESITKDIFDDLTIIGQWDNKFIIALVKQRGMVVLFDQHAVHERIRLENLLEEYIEVDQEAHKFKTTKCNEPVVFELNNSEINILLNYQHLLEDLGLIYKISTNNIYIYYVPTCIYNRILKNPKKYQEIELKKFVCSLVSEEINTILSTRGIGIKIPTLMQNILNSEACRGAIKFGDKLNLNKCADLIQKLSKCKLPFQCAHGRPTITPVMNLQQNVYNKQTKINFDRLKY